MADYFQSQPNFTNPSYATPEQLATQRAYAAELSKRSGENVNRPAGAAANIITALTAGLTRNNADSMQQQAAQGNARDTAALISQLQSGKVDPSTAAQIYANPMASPESRNLITALIKPEAVKSELGQPAYQSPAAGVQAAPIQGNYTPAYRVNQGAEGVHTDAPILAPGASPTGPPVQSSPKVWGDQEAQAAGLYPPQPGAVPVPAPRPAAAPQGAPVAPAAAPPQPAPAAAPSAPTAPLTLDQLAAKGREFAAQKAYTQGTADAQTNIAKADLDAAASAPTIKRVAGVMLDDLKTHGDKMTFGPTAEWSNNVKRVAANYAPGLMKDQLESLASADSFEKMSAQLTSMLSKGGGTDAQLFNNMKSVPGQHNSKEGAQALLQMVSQVADQQQGLRQYTGGAKTAQEYEQLRNQYYAQNPVVNPLTGNPIKMDLEKDTATDNGGFKVIKVH